MSFNKTYHRGAVSISLADVVLVSCALYYIVTAGYFRIPMTRQDMSLAWVVCSGAVEVLLGWVLQIILKYFAPQAFLSQLFMALRSISRGVMYVAMFLMAVDGFVWVFYHFFV
jgi:hypothetical protein